VHPQAKILAGDDLIVYGTGQTTGVDYIIPSAGDVAGRGIADGGSFSSTKFAIAGKKVALVNATTGAITIFNASTGTTALTGVSAPDGTTLSEGSGNYFAVTDGTTVKVINVTNASPSVVTFTNAPPNHAKQISVDGTNKAIAVFSSNTFCLYDITNPSSTLYSFFSIIGADVQLASPFLFNNGKIFFCNATDSKVFLLNLAGTGYSMNYGPSTGGLAMAGNRFGYFFKADSSDAVGENTRSAIGPVSGAPDAVTATVPGVPIDGSSSAHGYVGFGSTIAITSAGDRYFIAGKGEIGAGEYLQVSSGGTFTVLPDPSASDQYGFPASDVSCSSNTVACKGGSGQNTVVSYIILN